jgi:hypothetical protein
MTFSRAEIPNTVDSAPGLPFCGAAIWAPKGAAAQRAAAARTRTKAGNRDVLILELSEAERPIKDAEGSGRVKAQEPRAAPKTGCKRIRFAAPKDPDEKGI